MARAKEQSNGRLEEAMRNMLLSMTELGQAQASLIQNQAAFLAQMSEISYRFAERFARIEAILLEHSQILAEHSRILQALPEAIREKIGFRTPELPPAG
jgi:hypothetical protein